MCHQSWSRSINCKNGRVLAIAWELNCTKGHRTKQSSTMVTIFATTKKKGNKSKLIPPSAKIDVRRAIKETNKTKIVGTSLDSIKYEPSRTCHPRLDSLWFMSHFTHSLQQQPFLSIFEWLGNPPPSPPEIQTVWILFTYSRYCSSSNNNKRTPTSTRQQQQQQQQQNGARFPSQSVISIMIHPFFFLLLPLLRTCWTTWTVFCVPPRLCTVLCTQRAKARTLQSTLETNSRAAPFFFLSPHIYDVVLIRSWGLHALSNKMFCLSFVVCQPLSLSAPYSTIKKRQTL